MKKLFLITVCVLMASQAAAVNIHVTQMDFYAPGQNMPIATDSTIGANPPAPPDIGVIDSTAVTGGFSSDVGPVYGDSYDGFFGLNWYANVAWASETPGPSSWSDTGPHGPFNYTFNLAAGDVAFGLLFNWGAAFDIPILAVFHSNGDGTWSPVDTDGDGFPGTAMVNGPFPALTAAFSGMSSGPVPPGIFISIDVDGGHVQQCSETGGDSIDFSTSIILSGGVELNSVEWSLDGESVGLGENITLFVPLGQHTVEALASTTTGESKTDSKEITVNDNIAPSIDAYFVDSRTGMPVEIVDAKHREFIQVKIDANDVCDPSPLASGTLVPVTTVQDGDEFTVKPGKIEMVSLPTSAVELNAKATDASGRTSTDNAVLIIE